MTTLPVPGVTTDWGSQLNDYLTTELPATFGIVVRPSSDTTGATDTAAINAALAADKAVYLTDGTYWLDGPLVSAGFLSLTGRGPRQTAVKATPGYSGFLINPASEFTVAGLSLHGSGVDGSFGIGAIGPGLDIGRPTLAHLSFYEFDYGIRFDRVDFNLSTHFEDIYMYGVRTAGAVLRADTTGGSTYTFDNFIVSNNGAVGFQSIPATGITVTANSPTTAADTIAWSATGAQEFGWQILRKPQGDMSDNAWRWVADVDNVTTSYQATKTVGTTFDYAVVRHTQGLYISDGKGIDVGALQCEYVGTGATFDTCRSVEIASVYTETRSTATQPVPRGSALVVKDSEGFIVHGGWAEGAVSGVYVNASGQVEVSSMTAIDCERSVIHLNTAGDAGNDLRLGPVTATGTTPAELTTSGSAFDHNVSRRTANTTENRETVNHPYRAEWEVQSRGGRRAALGADATTDAGYLYLSEAPLPTATVSYVGQLRRVAGVLYECVDNGGTYAWVPLARQVTTPDTVWIAPALQNSWQNQAGYNTAGYRRDALGWVHLKGAVNSGSGVVFTLPAGYRPAANEPRSTITSGGTTRVDVGSDGTVGIYGAYSTYASIDGISFYAA